MVSNGEKNTKGMGKWFVKTMLKRPSTWVALGVGGFIFATAVGTIGPVGAMFMGGIGGFTAGAFTFLIHAGIATSYLKSKTPDTSSERAQREARESALIAELRLAGLQDDAALIEKILRDRDAIRLRAAELADQPDAVHSAELVEAVGMLAVRSGDALQDLVRRHEDPHLNAPADVESQIAAARDELRQAYQAVVDTRTRLRKGQFLSEADIVAVNASGTLRGLTEQLQAETRVAELVEKRLQDDELLHGLHLAEREFPEDEPPERLRE